MFKIGDKVIIQGSAEETTYIGCIFEVLSEPYIVCGSELVKIKCYETGKYFGGGYTTEFLKKVDAPQVCNICGKEFDMWDVQENFGLHYIVGYGSKYDLNKISLSMCCDCFDRIFDYILPQCKINPLTEYDI